jgi:cob(I)alamin adenosyltransferase
MKIKGLIHVYTGEGKGKTTASVGLAVRARGHNLKVCFIYFHKNTDKWIHGEHEVLEKIGVDVFGFAKQSICLENKFDADEVREECLKGIAFIKKMFKEKKYDLIVLDEINISYKKGFLTEQEILDILDFKPEELELVLTGRGAGEKIIEKADLVSFIKKIKHPYELHVKRRKGIEY